MKLNRTLVLTILMVTGEIVFLLPFVVARIFRPTFLKVFEINNLELGTAFSVYGIIAMISYFAGGPIADRFSPRKLMSFSLLLTAVGGVFMASIPNIFGLTMLYAFWGMSTILLYWSASIKAIRAYGGNNTQGIAFGLVDGGRGFIAAVLASISVWVFSIFLPVAVEVATPLDMAKALSQIIYLFIGLIIGSAALIWIAFPKDEIIEKSKHPQLSLNGVRSVIKKRSIWLQGIIVLCAYVGYKTTDDFSLYASDVLGYNDLEAAQVATISFWVRPFAALAAGWLGDKFQFSKVVNVCFTIIILGSIVLSSGILKPNMPLFIMLIIASTSVGIYGLRGVYFALFQESKIPLLYTGSAAGMVSLIGYTPDVFMGPLMGYVLDSSPGMLGHQHLFGVLVVFGVIGLFASILFQKQGMLNK
jgi:sugar phosphate permease